MTAFEAFFTLGGNNLLSIGLGLVSWVLPLLYLCIKKRREFFTCGSLACVAVSLYFQLREVLNRVYMRDFAAIEDTIGAVCFCASVLIAVTLILNILAWSKKGPLA